MVFPVSEGLEEVKGHDLLTPIEGVLSCTGLSSSSSNPLPTTSTPQLCERPLCGDGGWPERDSQKISAILPQEAFTVFRAHYLFDAHDCTPGEEEAHEKGLVDGLVGLARRHTFVPVPTALDEDDLAKKLLAFCEKDRGPPLPPGGGDHPGTS